MTDLTLHYFKNGPQNPTELMILMILGDWADCNTGIVEEHPTEPLADKVGVSKRTFIRYRKKLEADGWFTLIKGNGRGHITIYKLHLARIMGCAQ